MPCWVRARQTPNFSVLTELSANALVLLMCARACRVILSYCALASAFSKGNTLLHLTSKTAFFADISRWHCRSRVLPLMLWDGPHFRQFARGGERWKLLQLPKETSHYNYSSWVEHGFALRGEYEHPYTDESSRHRFPESHCVFF